LLRRLVELDVSFLRASTAYLAAANVPDGGARRGHRRYSDAVPVYFVVSDPSDSELFHLLYGVIGRPEAGVRVPFVYQTGRSDRPAKEDVGTGRAACPDTTRALLGRQRLRVAQIVAARFCFWAILLLLQERRRSECVSPRPCRAP
jgi:hypothetical protein